MFDFLDDVIDEILAEAPAKPAKPVIRVYAGSTVTEAMLKQALGITTAAEKLQLWAESTVSDHVAGGKCPHCNGTGRYRFHTDHTRNDKCYRCDGKGTLDGRDLAFFHRRVGGAAPINWIRSAV